MTTQYPFRLLDHLVSRLPPPASDGLCDIDVKVNGAWDGILVSKPDGICIGIRVRGRVKEYQLPFECTQIEDVRPACLWNRALTWIAFDLLGASLFGILILSPLLLIVAHFAWQPVSVVAIVICVASILGMYSMGGFIFLRLPAAMFGLAQILCGVGEILVWLKKGV